METTFEPLHLDKEILAQEKIMYIIYNCIWIIVLFSGAYKCGNVAIFWGYVGTNADILWPEFCNVCNLTIAL
jgi:hypothetical protein